MRVVRLCALYRFFHQFEYFLPHKAYGIFEILEYNTFNNVVSKSFIYSKVNNARL